MIQIFFKDDELVASDGAYIRAIRSRKWIYLLCIIVIAFKGKFYNEGEDNSLIRILTVPSEVISLSSFIGLTYLITIYMFVLAQLWSSYEVILKSRFQFRNADDLKSINELIENTNEKIISIQSEFDKSKKKTSKLLRDLTAENKQFNKSIIEINNIIEDHYNGGDLSKITLNSERKRIKDQIAHNGQLIFKYRNDLLKIDEDYKNQSAIMEDEMEKLFVQRREIIKEDFYSNKIYRNSEIIIDTMKLIAPFVFYVYAASCFVRN